MPELSPNPSRQQFTRARATDRARIYGVRAQKVILDSGLAELNQVETFNLNKAVKRNCDRFPDDFMLQLSPEEAEPLTFQIGMSKPEGRGGRRTRPCAFTPPHLFSSP
jgi:hypothetical protein